MAAATQRDVDAAAMRRLAVEVGCVAAIVLGLFTLLSLLSYGGLDPDGLPVRGGWTGPAGKYLAFALYQILGHGALLVPPAAVLGAVVCLAGRGGAFHPLRILGVLACLVLASSLLHVGWAGESVRGGHDAGGFVGAQTPQEQGIGTRTRTQNAG